MVMQKNAAKNAAKCDGIGEKGAGNMVGMRMRCDAERSGVVRAVKAIQNVNSGR
jgi:hypothetical protein